jgi:hypothetical protein
MTIGRFATGRVRDGRGASVTEGVPCPFREPPVNLKTSHQPKTPRPMKTKIVLRDLFSPRAQSLRVDFRTCVITARSEMPTAPA